MTYPGATRMHLVRFAIPAVLVALVAPAIAQATAGAPPSASAAATVRWAGTDANDLGPASIILSTQNGRVRVSQFQLIMACTDAEDGTESSRAFDAVSSPRVSLSRNRFTVTWSPRSGGRDGTVRVTGTLGSNGRGTTRISVNAEGRDAHGTIVERCGGDVRIPVRRGPSA